MIDLEDSINRLDEIIGKARVLMYKPIQIAEVLYASRIYKNINVKNLDEYKNPSIHWRDTVTIRLYGKRSTSSAQYQHNIWDDNAMPPEMMELLDIENKQTGGAVEKHIYECFGKRQQTIISMINYIESSDPNTFQLSKLLELFQYKKGIRRSIDKAYEIITYSLLETVVTTLEATIRVSVPMTNIGLLEEFSDLAKVILGIDKNNIDRNEYAHLYRVGVTNAADRGLDMWANFGPAIQVKHLTLNENLANEVIDQIEGDNIVIVCKDADAKVINMITNQIGWGIRVRGIIRESQLIDWYEKCLRGKFKDKLSIPLLNEMMRQFDQEFPQATSLTEFMRERHYLE